MFFIFTGFKNWPSIAVVASTLMTLLFSHTSLSEAYTVKYEVELKPRKKIAEVSINLEHQAQVKSIDFNLSRSQCSRFKSSDKIEKSGDRLIWFPDEERASLSYRCRIKHKRDGKNNDGYDASITRDWTIFRGDDLVPPARVVATKGASSDATLSFTLPDSWPAVNTGWPAIDPEAKPSLNYKIDKPDRDFDRPTGWMIAGDLGTRRVELDSGKQKTRVSVSAPKGSEFRRMDALAFIIMAWPEMSKAFPITADELLIVGGDDPMWRGGLSASNSLYVHSSRPIVSENGTSTLIHELFHMLTGIRGKKGHDWIAEGLAEFYSIELLYRMGASNDERRAITLDSLEEWSSDVSTLIASSSSGSRTAAAVLLFYELDEEIRSLTNGQKNVDGITRELVSIAEKGRRVSLDDVKNIFKETTGEKSKTLSSSLLNKKT